MINKNVTIGINLQYGCKTGNWRFQENFIQALNPNNWNDNLDLHGFTFGYRYQRDDSFPNFLKYHKTFIPGRIQLALSCKFKVPVEAIFRLPKLDLIIDFGMTSFKSNSKVCMYVPDVAWREYKNGEYETTFSKRSSSRTEEGIRKADYIFTISDYSKNQIRKWFPDIRSDIFNIPLGSSFKAMDMVSGNVIKKRLKISKKRFFLYVGAINARKNIEILGRAMDILGDDFLLVHAGPEPAEGLAFWGLDKKNILSLGYVSDSCLHYLYKECFAIIFPSKIEGFGLPLVEGMFYRKPIICSNIPIFKEIGQDCPIYFDPNDPNDLAIKMRYLAGNSNIIDGLAEKGSFISGKYTWENTRGKVIEMLQNILAKQPN